MHINKKKDFEEKVNICCIKGETQTGTNTLAQTEPEGNGNERVLHTLQNWSLTIRYSLVSYSGHTLFFASGRGLTSTGDTAYCMLCQQGGKFLRWGVVIIYIIYLFQPSLATMSKDTQRKPEGSLADTLWIQQPRWRQWSETYK